MTAIAAAARRLVARHHRSMAIVAGSLLVIAGVGMVALPAALVLGGVALIGFFGIDFGRAR
jgi:hypothetical protein